MKIFKVSTLFVCLFLFYGCPPIDDFDPIPLSIYEPVVMQRGDFENTTELLPPRAIVETGKIYIKDDFLFINEPNEGFHVFNNQDPSNPEKIAFIKVLGSSDVSIKNRILYFNNATDLIAVLPDYSDFSLQITKRVRSAFPQQLSPDDMYFYVGEDEVIVNWNLID